VIFHAGKRLPPVELIAPCEGPIWFSSRMVEDEWRRSVRGVSTRFALTQPRHGDSPSRSPSRGRDSGPSSSSAKDVEISLRSISTSGQPKPADPLVVAEGGVDTFRVDEYVVSIPLIGNRVHHVSQALVEEYQRAYPAIDVLQNLNEMRMWSIANPTLRKTPRGVSRFINAWLARAQDRAGNRGQSAFRSDAGATGRGVAIQNHLEGIAQLIDQTRGGRGGGGLEG